MKRIRLVMPGLDPVPIARLLEACAPRTCDAIWSSLPLEGQLFHGIWSGPEVYLPIDPGIAVAPEHLIHQTQVGDVGYFAQPGGLMEGWPDDLAELAFFYGRGARPYMPTGPVSVNLFARIDEHVTEFARACDRIRFQGVTRLRVERDD